MRRGWHYLTDERSRRAVELTEAFVDDEADEADLNDACDAALNVERAIVAAQPGQEIHWSADPALEYPLAAAWVAAVHDEYTYGYIGGPSGRPTWGATTPADRRAETDLLRDVLGNPFRPGRIDSGLLAWRDATIPKLAQAAYDERELPAGCLQVDRLRVLADALEEAGCTSEVILSHLRGPGPHVRACWVLDLLLGKE